MSYDFIKANKENDFYPVNQSEIEEIEKKFKFKIT